MMLIQLALSVIATLSQPEPALPEFMSLIPKESKPDPLPNYRFRSIFHYINDSPYSSIEEAPINGALKEALKARSGVTLFFGFSDQI